MPDEEALAPTEPSASSTTAVETQSDGSHTSDISPPGGYDTIASFMANDSKYAIVRRFGYLNSLNILCLQAELVDLEQELEGWAEDDRMSADSKRRVYRHSWRAFSRHEVDPDSQDKSVLQWDTMLRIREVLKQYSGLLFHSRNDKD